MKTNFLNFKSVFFILIIIGLVSCKGEIGPPGADGVDGIDGVNGVDGEDGNANVISSGWVEYDDAVWTGVTSEFGIDYRNYPITVSEITQDIVDNGVVLVYSRFVISATQTYMLPFTENVTGADPIGQTVSFRFELEDLTLKMRNASGTGDPGTFGGPGVAEYRYIIIPPANTKSANSKEAILKELNDAGVDINDYHEVMDYYGLDY